MNAIRDIARHHARSRHAGFGIVELMIALAIGTFLVAGAVSIYLKARDVRAALDTSARLQEIARYALAIIEADVRMAGFWGLTNRSEAITANAALTFPAKCGGTAWITQALRHVDGTNNTYLALPNCVAGGGGAVPGSDVLVLRRASAQRISPQRPIVDAASRDRVLVITSHTDGQIFVPADIANQIPAGYATSDIAGEPPQADTRALLVNAYYVSTGSSLSPDYPALRRKTLVAGPSISDQEVIAGVEELAVPGRPGYGWRPGCGPLRKSRCDPTGCAAGLGAHMASRTGRGARPVAGHPGNRGLRGPGIEHCH